MLDVPVTKIRHSVAEAVQVNYVAFEDIRYVNSVLFLLVICSYLPARFSAGLGYIHNILTDRIKTKN